MPDAWTAALRLIAGREMTAAQLHERLRRRGFTAEEAAGVVQRLREEGTVDDRRAARIAARKAATVKGRGRWRVCRELDAMGVPPEVTREVVAEIFAGLDETAVLDQALDRRLHGAIENPAHYRRLHAALVRLGFAPSQVAARLKARARGPTHSEE
jgi:regulatory protein